MKKFFIWSILLSLGLYAQSIPLFAKVMKLKENDTLNVRSQASYHASKVGEIPSQWYMGVEKCKEIGYTKWCKIYPLMQMWSDKFGPQNTGWVNAKYLIFFNQGYVIVDGKKDCSYVLDCQGVKCEVVNDYILDENYTIVNMETRWINRKMLKGESSFGATSEDEEGICNTAMFVEKYLKEKR